MCRRSTPQIVFFLELRFFKDCWVAHYSWPAHVCVDEPSVWSTYRKNSEACVVFVILVVVVLIYQTLLPSYMCLSTASTQCGSPAKRWKPAMASHKASSQVKNSRLVKYAACFTGILFFRKVHAISSYTRCDETWAVVAPPMYIKYDATLSLHLKDSVKVLHLRVMIGRSRQTTSSNHALGTRNNARHFEPVGNVGVSA